MGDSTDVAIRQDGLLAQAIEKGMDTETLGKLIALRNAEIERQAKAEFSARFAEMQRDFVPVARSRTVTDYNGRKLYAFCPLEDILQANAPIIAKHGFSYRWSEESLENREKRIWCIVSGFGHEERSYVDIPYIEGTKTTNAIQQRGSSTSYGKRYSFLNAFGIIVAGEDTDAQPIQVPQDAQGGAAKPSADASPTQGTADTLRAAIKAQIGRFVSIMEQKTQDGVPYFSDEEKATSKAKIAVAKGATQDALDYVKTVVAEYQGILDDRLNRKAAEAERKADFGRAAANQWAPEQAEAELF